MRLRFRIDAARLARDIQMAATFTAIIGVAASLIYWAVKS